MSKFLPIETHPTSRQIKLMLGLAIDEGVLAVFKHHDYSFGQDVRLQQEVEVDAETHDSYQINAGLPHLRSRQRSV